MRLDVYQELLGVGQLSGIHGVEGITEVLQGVADSGQLIVVNHRPAREVIHRPVEEILPAGKRIAAVMGRVHRKAGRSPILRHGVERAVDATGVGESRIEGAGVVVRQL